MPLKEEDLAGLLEKAGRMARERREERYAQKRDAARDFIYSILDRIGIGAQKIEDPLPSYDEIYVCDMPVDTGTLCQICITHEGGLYFGIRMPDKDLRYFNLIEMMFLLKPDEDIRYDS